MACMSHNCLDCGLEWFDNSASAACLRCGSANVTHSFDEQPSHADWDDDDINDWYDEDE